MAVVDALVPVVSVLLGAGITYYLNVRQRRMTAVEDLFAKAIAAVAAAEASIDYIGQLAPWRDDVSPEEYRAFLHEVGREASVNHIRKVAEAREALAQVVPFREGLTPFYRIKPTDLPHHATEIIAELRKGPDRSSR